MITVEITRKIVMMDHDRHKEVGDEMGGTTIVARRARGGTMIPSGAAGGALGMMGSMR